MSLNKKNIYLLILGILIILYMLNTFLEIGGVKVFNFLIPFIFLYYLFNPIIKVNNELIILFLFLLFIFISIFCGEYNEIDSNILLHNAFRIGVIFFILFPLYYCYPYNYKLFDKLFLLSIVFTVLSNLTYYFLYYDHINRFRATFGNPNEFSLVLVFMIYFMFYYIKMYGLSFKRKFIRSVSIVLLILGLNLLVLITLSRSGIIILGVFYIFYIFSIRKSIKIYGKICIFIFCTIILITLSYYFSKQIGLLITRFTDSEGTVSSHMRLDQINAGINLLIKHPLQIILGSGIASTEDTEWFKNFYDISYQYFPHRIHNTIFSVLIENGVIGVILFIYYNLIVLIKIIKSKSNFKYAVLGIFIAIFLYSQAAYILYFFPYWLGMILISLQIDRLNNIKG